MNNSNFKCKGKIFMEANENYLRFITLYSQPNNFRHKDAVVNSYMETEGLYKLPLRINMTVSLDAPGFCVMLGETGRIHFCSTWDENRRIEDIAEMPMKHKSMFFANQMPLNT